jgi:mono/diheme cytochrome c family protein
MKKILRIFLYLISIFLIFIILFFLYIQIKGIPSYETVQIDYHAEYSPERMERGKVLVGTLCIGCHINREVGNLSGGLMPDVPKEFGTIYSQNITNDKQYGIGNWTDAEIMYLLRTGIKKNGMYAPPYMAKLPALSDEDMASVIVFLRSDDPLVAASPIADKPCEPSFLTKVLTNTIFKPFPFPKEEIQMPDTSNKVEWGRYLAVNMECYSCHSADFVSNDFLNPEKSVGYFGGGNKPLNLEGKVMLTPNLTPDKETGIGKWSKEQFINAVKSGKVEGQEALRYPMNPYIRLSDAEVGAIYEYLMTIPPISNKVERTKL